MRRRCSANVASRQTVVSNCCCRAPPHCMPRYRPRCLAGGPSASTVLPSCRRCSITKWKSALRYCSRCRWPNCSVPIAGCTMGCSLPTTSPPCSVQIAGEAARERLALWSAARALPVPAGGAQLWLLPADLERFPELVAANPRQWRAAPVGVEPADDLFAAPVARLCRCQRTGPAIAGARPDPVRHPGRRRLVDSTLEAAPRRPAARRACALPAAIRANRDNPRLLKAGDRVVCSAGWLGQCSISIE